MNGWSIPFERDPAGPSPMADDPVLAGSVVVMSAVIDSSLARHIGRHPALVFRFAGPDGRFMPPIALVLDDAHMAAVATLVTAAVAAARKAARA